MRHRGLAGRGIEGGQLDRHFRPGAIEKFFHRSAARAEGRLDRQPALIEGAAVAQRMNRHDAKRENFPLRFEQTRKRTPYISVTDERQFQKSSFSIIAASSDSSAVFLSRRSLWVSRRATILVSFAASWLAYC